MLDLLYQGGPLFMGVLSILFLYILVITSIKAMKINRGETLSNLQLSPIRSVGLLALVVGILGQFIGLYSGLEMVENSMEISSAILAGGIRVSMITTIYGLIIFVIALSCWMGLRRWMQQKGKL